MSAQSELRFHVDDMSCQHCVDVITRNVKEADSQAVVQVDLGAHTVRVESALPVQTISAAIATAGYTPVPA